MDTRILVVDFDANDLGALERALRAEGLTPLPARDRAEALERCRDQPPGAVLVAVDPRQARHREVVHAVKAGPWGPTPILFFGHARDHDPVRAPSEALAEGGDYFFGLPCDLAYLAGRVRAWAERGAHRLDEVEGQEPQVEGDPPELEGMAVGSAPVRLPALDLLREPASPPETADWSWIAELDPSEVHEDLRLEGALSPEPAGHENPLPERERAEGVGTEEQAALLFEAEAIEVDLDDDGEDALGAVRIEEVDEMDGALGGQDEVWRDAVSSLLPLDPSETPWAPVVAPPSSSPVARLLLAPSASAGAVAPAEGRPPDQGPRAADPRFERVSMPTSVPEVLTEEDPNAWAGDESLFCGEAPLTPLALEGDEPPPRLFEAPIGPSPRSVAFPRIQPENGQPIVSGSPKRNEGLADDTLDALRSLLERPVPHQRERRRRPVRPMLAPNAERRSSLNPHRAAQQFEFEPEEPTITGASGNDGGAPSDPHHQPFSGRSPSSTLGERSPRPNGAPARRAQIDLTPPTLSPPSPLCAQPQDPIEEDEETQELFAPPLLAASGGEDFPPGALTIVHQAESQRERGDISEACAGYALAAQIYLDYGLSEPARSLYRHIIQLRPNDPLATRRLAQLERASPADRTGDLELEFVDEAQGRDPRPALSCSPAADLALEQAPKERLHLNAPPASPTSELGPALIPRADRPAVALGVLRPTPLSPDSGVALHLGDMVELFLRARSQRATGVLRFGQDDLGILLAHGVPGSLVGCGVAASFLRLVADVGRIGESHAQRLVASSLRSPRALARRLKAQGHIHPEEEILLPTRQLEDRLVRALQHRGPWRFEASTAEMATADLVPRVGELREWLVELLPRSAPEDELRAAVGLINETVRLVPGTEHFVPDNDSPLVTLLDGHRGLEEAARLAGVPVLRSFAFALVWLREGLAERVERARASSMVYSPASQRDRGSPTLADLPPLRRPTSSFTDRPSAFRLERTKPRAGTSEPRSRLSHNPVAPRIDAQAAENDTPKVKPTNELSALSEPADRPRSLADLDDDARIQAMAEMVRTRDYFGILNVDATASRRTIDDAHRRMRSLIPEEVSTHLEAMVREVLRSVDEARDVLLIPELRAAYEQHVEPRA